MLINLIEAAPFDNTRWLYAELSKEAPFGGNPNWTLTVHISAWIPETGDNEDAYLDDKGVNVLVFQLDAGPTEPHISAQDCPYSGLIHQQRQD
jgi:hypothetical protein